MSHMSTAEAKSDDDRDDNDYNLPRLEWHSMDDVRDRLMPYLRGDDRYNRDKMCRELMDCYMGDLQGENLNNWRQGRPDDSWQEELQDQLNLLLRKACKQHVRLQREQDPNADTKVLVNLLVRLGFPHPQVHRSSQAWGTSLHQPPSTAPKVEEGGRTSGQEHGATIGNIVEGTKQESGHGIPAGNAVAQKQEVQSGPGSIYSRPFTEWTWYEYGSILLKPNSENPGSVSSS